MGLDRITMLKYGIPDLRDMFSADLRWLRHYGFAALDVPTLAGGLSPDARGSDCPPPVGRGRGRGESRTLQRCDPPSWLPAGGGDSCSRRTTSA